MVLDSNFNQLIKDMLRGSEASKKNKLSPLPPLKLKEEGRIYACRSFASFYRQQVTPIEKTSIYRSYLIPDRTIDILERFKLNLRESKKPKLNATTRLKSALCPERKYNLNRVVVTTLICKELCKYIKFLNIKLYFYYKS